MRSALRVAEFQLLAGRRHWRRQSVLILSPVCYLAAIGLGLGSVVDHNVDQLGVSSYLRFLAPGLLAATAMQTAANDNSWPVFGASRENSFYHLMVTAPIRIHDVAIGQLVWTIGRLCAVLLPLYAVMAALHALQGFSGLLTLPAAVLTGASFGPVIAALAATVRRTTGISVLLGLVITPLFLLGGTFFPVERLPGALYALAWCTPLYHGVALTRGLTIDRLGAGMAVAHVSVLMAYVVVGLLLSRRALARRLGR